MGNVTETTLIAVTGSEMEYGPCRDSVLQIKRGAGDELLFGRGTKGYEVRQRLIDRFIESDHEWLLMLDADMIFAPDTLTRLQAHRVQYVSGYYLQRRYQPMIPIWFHADDEWPPRLFTEVPERGRLHRLGGSGWGCVLIHRDVIETTRARVLKGAWDVLEDEMTFWPYDAGVVMAALRDGDIDTLRRELRPLRGQYDRQPVGSDIRYPFFARAAGFTLWGDPDVTPEHMINYPLTATDYSAQDAAIREAVADSMIEATARGRALWRGHMEALCG